MAGIQFPARVTDITYQNIMPSIVDQINNSTVFLARTLNRPGSWRGVYESQPIETANSVTGGFFTGMDPFPTSATNNTQLLTWYVAAYEQSVVVPGIERAINSFSPKQVLSLLKTRLDEAKTSAIISVSTASYAYGSGADIDGLGLIVDNGASSSSYAGITRSTNTFINGDITNVGSVNSGIITLDYLSSEQDNVRAASSRQETPTMGLTTKTDWTYIEGLIQPMVSARYDTLQLNGYDQVDGGTPMGTSRKYGQTSAFAGFDAITYRARPIVADDACTSGNFFWLNENYIEFRRLVDDSLRQISSTLEVTESYLKDVGFPSAWQYREQLMPVNQYGTIGFLLLMGNLICRQPRRNGLLTGISGN
jgi:hypothetical protein